MTIAIKIDKLVLVKINELKLNPNNLNDHPQEQIDILVRVIQANGFRHAIVVSTRSGLVVAGHGRIIAAKILKMTHLPVSHQEFDSPEEEFQWAVADNELQKQSILNLSKVHTELINYDAFDVELLAIPNFQFEPIIGDFVNEEPKDKMKFYTCPHCKKEFEEKQAKLRVEQ